MILHIDLNSFYASCAVIKSGGLYTFDTPLMVCGDPKKRHGIVLAATYPAKRTGVRAGMPIREACARCPQAILSEPDYRMYMEYSERFMDIIKNYSPLIMRYGIDEAYLDYAGCEHLFGPPVTAANTIRERVKRELGLTVSVGVGENPLMAKMGSDYKKPDAVTVIDRASWEKLIWPLPAGSLMYVGRACEARLNAMGINTVGELAAVPLATLKTVFGKAGAEMWMHANGMDDTLIQSQPEPQKCISNSSTLPEDINTTEGILPLLLAQMEGAAYRLRECGMRAGVAGVHLRYRDLSNISRQTTLKAPTDITGELCGAVRSLCKALELKMPVRQVGVRLAGLTDEAEQLSLLEGCSKDKFREFDAAADGLRRKFGPDVLMRCSTMGGGEKGEVRFSPFTRH